MNIKRISSGIPELDAMIGGGLPEGKTLLVTGGPGAGKSIFCLQFLLAGLRKQEKAVYVAVDEKPADVLEQADSLGWNLSKHANDKDLMVLDSARYFTSRVAGSSDKEIDIPKFVGDLSSYVKSMNATRLVIDPAGPLILVRGTASRIQDNARQLVRMLQSELSTTNLLTCYPVPRVGDKSEHGVEEYLAAGVIYLRMARADGRIARTLSIQKMRSTALDAAEASFTIAEEKGIVLQPPTRP